MEDEESCPMPPSQSCRWQERREPEPSALFPLSLSPSLPLSRKRNEPSSELTIGNKVEDRLVASLGTESSSECEHHQLPSRAASGVVWEPREDVPGHPARRSRLESANEAVNALKDATSAANIAADMDAFQPASQLQDYAVPASVLSFADGESDEEDALAEASKPSRRGQGTRRDSCTRIVSRIYYCGGADVEVEAERLAPAGGSRASAEGSQSARNVRSPAKPPHLGVRKRSRIQSMSPLSVSMESSQPDAVSLCGSDVCAGPGEVEKSSRIQSTTNFRETSECYRMVI